jgi:hypothetical protein
MEIDAEVESKPLNDREGARMQRSNRTQSVLLFDPASEVLVEPPVGGLQHASKQHAAPQPLVAMVVDVEPPRPTFLGYFLREELLCADLPPRGIVSESREDDQASGDVESESPD